MNFCSNSLSAPHTLILKIFTAKKENSLHCCHVVTSTLSCISGATMVFVLWKLVRFCQCKIRYFLHSCTCFSFYFSFVVYIFYVGINVFCKNVAALC